MIWIIGEYAERIDNAAELLESFLEGFQDENTQVEFLKLSAVVLSLFLTHFALFFAGSVAIIDWDCKTFPKASVRDSRVGSTSSESCNTR